MKKALTVAIIISVLFVSVANSQVINAENSPSLTIIQDEHFVVRHQMWAFAGFHLLCSFTATSGDYVKLNISSTNIDQNRPNDVYIVDLEIASINHGSIFIEGTNFMQTITLNYSDAYNITVSKRPFYSSVAVSGAIDLHHNETPTPTSSHSSSPSPSPTESLSPTPSSYMTQAPTMEPSPTSDNTQDENFLQLLIIFGLVAVVVAVGLLVYFKKRKG